MLVLSISFYKNESIFIMVFFIRKTQTANICNIRGTVHEIIISIGEQLHILPSCHTRNLIFILLLMGIV